MTAVRVVSAMKTQEIIYVGYTVLCRDSNHQFRKKCYLSIIYKQSHVCLGKSQGCLISVRLTLFMFYYVLSHACIST